MLVRISVGVGREGRRVETYRDDVSSEKGSVETRYIPRLLTIVLRQAKEQHAAHGPHETGHHDAHGQDDLGRRTRSTGAVCIHIRCLCQCRSPIPQCDDVDLLRALNDTGAVCPRVYGRAAFIAKVHSEEDGSAGRGNRVEGCGDVLDPTAGVG